ncbi:MAG: alpha/beta fold hydrolase [Thermomicrobium sp.]|nr:alpha/beta fold hydrolase [Thermomicrobium sp.]
MSDLWLSVAAAFDAPEHRPFVIDGGEPGAVLVHGFLGTPKEWRPLAGYLERRGWTLVAPLLPGFGVGLPALPAVTLDDWMRALREAYARIAHLQQRVLVGYSLGGALATILASEVQATRLVLFAPFSRLPLPIWYRALLPLAQRFHSGLRPFARVDLEHPEIQQALAGWNPALDLSDPVVRAELRALRFPWRLLRELDRTAAAMRRSARLVSCPVAIVHGLDDRTVPIGDSRRLRRLFHRVDRFVEIPSDHQLLSPDHPGFAKVLALVDSLLVTMQRTGGDRP